MSDVSFGSGAGPLVSMTEGPVTFELRWRGADLPVPDVQGSQATYRNVLEDVDLVVTAEPDGFRQALVVRTPEAGLRLASTDVEYAYTVHGGLLRENADRSLSVMAGGDEVLVAPAPTMWDTEAPSAETVAQVPELALDDVVAAPVEGPDGLTQERPLDVEVTPDTLTLTPDSGMLTDPATVFPVVIDPPFSAGIRNRWMVDRAFPTTSYPNWADADQGVGIVYENGREHVKRLFWEFDVSAMSGKQILGATFAAAATHSYSCTPAEVELWLVHGMPGGATWNNQPSFDRELDARILSYGRPGCTPSGNVDPNDRYVELNATSAVAQGAAQGWPILYLALKGSDIDVANRNYNSWKRFRPDAVLSVTYNSTPSVGPAEVPYGKPCRNDQGNEPYTADSTPDARFIVNDPDGLSGSVRGVVSVWRPGGPKLWETTTPLTVSGTWQGVGLGGLGVDGEYAVLIIPQDEVGAQGPHQWCDVILDTTRPRPPRLSSTDYPSDRWAGGATTPGTFTLNPDGETDVAEYRYSLDNDATSSGVVRSGSDTPISLTPGSPGRHTLYVRSVDRAGNQSDLATYTFNVSTPGDAVVYRFDEPSGAVAFDGSGRGFHAVAEGAAAGGDGSGRSGAVADRTRLLDGTDDVVSVQRGAVVDTSQGFTVSALVERSRGARAETVASMDGTSASSFTLGWRDGSGRFAFRYNARDDHGAPQWIEAGTTLPVAGSGASPYMTVSGVYETAVRNSATVARALLYVDGELVAQTDWQSARAFRAPGSLRVGRAGGPCASGVCGSEHWNGLVDEVRVVQAALSAAEVRSYATTGATRTRFTPSMATGDDTLLAARQDALASPDGNTVLTMQADGNLVLSSLRDGSRSTLWSTATQGSGATRAVLQADGNLVVYAGTSAVWSSGTNGTAPGGRLHVQNDGQIVISKLTGGPVWSRPTTPRETDERPPSAPTAGPAVSGTPKPGSGAAGVPSLPGYVVDGAAQPHQAATATVGVPTPGMTSVGDMDLGLAAATTLPGPTPVEVSISAVPTATATAAGAAGLVRVEPAGEPGSVALRIGIDDFAGSSDWDSRATIYEMPACAATTPTQPQCQTRTALSTQYTGSGATAAVKADVQVTTTSVFAVASDTGDQAGSWAATPLAPAASWRVAENTGDFTWSYPLEVPGLDHVPGPALGLSYSSGSVDGRTSGTNNQASWVGDGFELSTGHVERPFVSCRDDRTGGNNASRVTGDLCWHSIDGRVVEDLQIVLDGRATRVIKDRTTGVWRLQEDDGSRFERVTGAPNGLPDGEHWKLTTTDGTQYFFGRTAPASSPAGTDTRSTWTVPVYGNHAGERCHAPGSFGASRCTQAWRWNLDYVVDVDGDSATVFYEREENRYGADGTPSSPVSYTRSGWISRVEYGRRAGSESSAAPVRVVFTTAERCIPSSGNPCAAGPIPAGKRGDWPDVPVDLICEATAASCPVSSPTFCTRKKLVQVQSEVSTGGSYRPVDRWTFAHQFPASGEGSAVAPTLWLETITRTAMDPAYPTDASRGVSLPPVRLGARMLPNRLDVVGDGAFALNRPRLNAIISETGATTTVVYREDADAGCAASGPRPDPATNTSRCFPSMYTIDGASGPTLHWFRKYVVDSVTTADRHATSPAVVTRYAYEGGGAWAYSGSDATPPAQRTWNQWRGYASVLTTVGGPTEANPSRTRTFYLRGMDGDYLAPGQRRAVTVVVDDPERDAASDPRIVDRPRYAGFVRATITYQGAGDTAADIATMTINEEPWTSAATATSVNGAVAPAQMIGERVSRALTRTTSGWQRHEVVTEYDATTGMPVSVSDSGDTAVTGDETCTRSTYVRNDTSWIRDRVSVSEVFAATCAAGGQRVRGEQTYFDGATTLTAAPSRGLPTRSDVLSGPAASATYRTVATTSYDQHGRAVSTTRDPSGINATSTVAFTPATGWPVTSVRSTNAKGHVSTTDVDPARGVITRSVDVRGGVTTLRHDVMGRLTGVWAPDRSVSGRATTEYAYVVEESRPPVVETRSLVVSGSATERYLSSFVVYDGLLRQRQTQSPDAAGIGRVVTDTVYDSRGLEVESWGPYTATGAPSATMLVGVTSPTVPALTVTGYDRVGRVTSSRFLSSNVEQWRVATSYTGDSVTSVPAAGTGAVVPQVTRPATQTFTDATGEVTRVRTFRGPVASGAFDDLTYSYAAMGEMTGSTDQAGNRWSWEYDVRGQLVRSVDPDRGTSSLGYDNAGRVVAATDARNATVSTTYDVLDRPLERRSGSALLASWAYDTASVANSTGSLTSAIRWVGSAGYVRGVSRYDVSGRAVEVFTTIPASEGSLAGTFTSSTSYNAAGGVARSSSPATPGLAGESRSVLYNGVGLVESVSGVLAQADYTSYGEVSRTLVSMAPGRFVTEERSYQDGTRWLARQVVSRVAPSWGANASSAPVPVRDASYTYSAFGDIWSVWDAAPAFGRCESFRYDGLGRVTDAWAKWTACPPVTASAPAMGSSLGGESWYQARYSYDASGNRTGVAHRDQSGTRTRSWSYPVGGAGVVRPHAPMGVTDQVDSGPASSTAVGYTAAGQVTDRYRVSGSGSQGAPGAVAGSVQQVSYDVEGRVSQVRTGAGAGASTVSWVYDADGGLLVKDDGAARTVYLGEGGGGREVSRVTATGVRSTVEVRSVGGVTVVETGTETASSVTAGLPSSARPVQATSTRAVTITDPHGSGVLQVDPQSLLVTGTRYTDPFGSPVATAATTASRRVWVGDRGFAGGHVEATSTLVQVGARVYDPAWGAFTSPDPVVKPLVPEQVHGVYAYAHHNPLAYTDPTGLEPRPIHAKAGQGSPRGHSPAANKASTGRYTAAAKAHATTTSRPAAPRPAARPVAPPRSGGHIPRTGSGWTGQQTRDVIRGLGDVAWEAGPGAASFLLRYGTHIGLLGGFNSVDGVENRTKERLDSWGGGRTDTRTNRYVYGTASVAVVFIPGPSGKTGAAGRVASGAAGRADDATRPTYRGDTRAPAEVFAGGFAARGRDDDLFRHALGTSRGGSAYVATSRSQQVAETFGPNVYVIRAENGIDVNAALGSRSPYPDEQEVAYLGGIPGGCVIGCTTASGQWIPNS